MKRMVICLFLALVVAAPTTSWAHDRAQGKKKKSTTAAVQKKKLKPTRKANQKPKQTVKKTAKQTVKKKTVKKQAVKTKTAKKKPTAKRHPNVPASLAGIFDDAAKRYRLDPVLLAAVAKQESRFRTRAVSPVGARGVMQLMPRTARALGVKDSFNPRQNIFGGAKYLRQLLDQFRGDVNLSLAAYNAGPGAVRRYRGIPPYRETRNYVASIRRDYDQARLR